MRGFTNAAAHFLIFYKERRIISFFTALVMAALVVNVPLPILAAGTYGELTYNVNVDVTV